MKPSRKLLSSVAALVCLLTVSGPGCNFLGAAETEDQPRLSMFIGVDVSGSFLKSKYYDDAIDFLANYISGHLNGFGGLERPRVLFVGSLGGVKKDEAKTFFPIQTFEGKSVAEIKAKLLEIFPKTHEDPYTDFNAFFQQVETTVKNKGLVLRPISVVLLSDGVPDYPGTKGDHDVRKIEFKPIELLSRNITVRLLYTSPTIGASWQNKIKRQRVKVWTQDAEVMVTWKDPKIFKPDTSLKGQDKFLGWVKDNVDFPVRMKRVD